mgnify:CR=1 FL=1
MLSVLLSIPKGLLEPSRCNKAICAITKPAIAKGRIKCKLKNLAPCVSYLLPKNKESRSNWLRTETLKKLFDE